MKEYIVIAYYKDKKEIYGIIKWNKDNNDSKLIHKRIEKINNIVYDNINNLTGYNLFNAIELVNFEKQKDINENSISENDWTYEVMELNNETRQYLRENWN